MQLIGYILGTLYLLCIIATPSNGLNSLAMAILFLFTRPVS